MHEGAIPVRRASYVGFSKALPSRKPKTAAEQSKDDMLTAGHSRRPVDAPQSDGVFCPTCGSHHRAGTVCPWQKSMQFRRAFEDLLKAEKEFFAKGGTNRWESGAPGGKGGQFAPKGSGKPTQGMRHSGPKRGGGGEGGDLPKAKVKGEGREAFGKPKMRPQTIKESAPQPTQEMGAKTGKKESAPQPTQEMGAKTGKTGGAPTQSEDLRQTAAAKPGAKLGGDGGPSPSATVSLGPQTAKQDGGPRSGEPDYDAQQAALEQRLKQHEGDDEAAYHRAKEQWQSKQKERQQQEKQALESGATIQGKPPAGAYPEGSREAQAAKDREKTGFGFDAYDRKHGDFSQRQMAGARAHAHASGADPTQQTLAEHAAWTDSYHAFQEARAQGIPANEVSPQNVGQLAGQWRQRQASQPQATHELGPEKIPGTDKPLIQAAQAMGESRRQAAGPREVPLYGPGQSPGPGRRMPGQASGPGPQESGQGAAAAARATPEQVADFRNRINQGQDPTDAARAALGQGKKPSSVEPIDLPQMDMQPMQITDTQGQPKEMADLPAEEAKTPEEPGGEKPPRGPKEYAPRPARGTGARSGILPGFSQMFGTGRAIGSGLFTPGGTVGPTGSFAAQQAHSLLYGGAGSHPGAQAPRYIQPQHQRGPSAAKSLPVLRLERAL